MVEPVLLYCTEPSSTIVLYRVHTATVPSCDSFVQLSFSLPILLSLFVKLVHWRSIVTSHIKGWMKRLRGDCGQHDRTDIVSVSLIIGAVFLGGGGGSSSKMLHVRDVFSFLF